MTTARTDDPKTSAQEPLETAISGIAPKVTRTLRWALPLATIVAAIAVGATYDPGAAILVLAGGALLGVIAVLWASVRTLSGETAITLEEAVLLGAPSATEEQKRAVLQALKDLDYERSVGKVSDADYEELLRRYRTEAKRLLRAVDEDLAPRRARAEAYLAKHLGKGATDMVAPKATGPRCASCQTENDADASFCKKCGSSMPAAAKDRQDATA
jgi:hypothetical protein